MTVIDMTDPKERAKAMASGLIWSAPLGAIKAALEDVAAGHIAPPTYIPAEYVPLAQQYGVEQAENDVESGPA
jgi:hypothetical protein